MADKGCSLRWTVERAWLLLRLLLYAPAVVIVVYPWSPRSFTPPPARVSTTVSHSRIAKAGAWPGARAGARAGAGAWCVRGRAGAIAVARTHRRVCEGGRR
jgi:hypothetical protein